MIVYSWRGLPLLVTNPNGWTPTGVPGPNDLGEIAVGIALMVNDAANPTFQLGATPPATAPTLYMIGHNAATVDVNESAGGAYLRGAAKREHQRGRIEYHQRAGRQRTI